MNYCGFDRYIRAPPNSNIFRATFADTFLRPAADGYVRKVGRPQLEWTAEVRKKALQMTGSIDRMCELVRDGPAWRQAVNHFLT